jgi:hypothetical protein
MGQASGGQNKERQPLSVSLKSGVSVQFKTRTEPSDSFKSISGIIRANSTGIHRVLVDRIERIFFGYDLELESLPETKTYRITIKPLDRDIAQELSLSGAMKELTAQPGANPGDARLLRFPPPQVVEDGDTLAFDILVNQKTGVKLVDLLTVLSPGALATSATQDPVPARDFSLEDVRLLMKDHQLFVNGELKAGGPTMQGSCEGEFIFFYLPGRGRYVFSIKAHEGIGFQKVGAIQNNRLSFAAGGESYEWVSSAPIVGGGGNWSLWVLHQPNYRPGYGAGNDQQFVFGAMDGARALRRE